MELYSNTYNINDYMEYVIYKELKVYTNRTPHKFSKR